MTTKQQQQRPSPVSEGERSLRLLKSIVGFQEDLKTEVAEAIESGQDVQIDYSVFDKQINNRMTAMLVQEKGIDAVDEGIEEEYDEDDENQRKKSAVRSIYKKNGGLYEIDANYTFTGSLNDFQNDPEKTTCTIKCSELNQDPHYQIIARSTVIEEYNPFPVRINIKFENMPTSVLSIDNVDRPLNEVHHTIFPNVSAPAAVSKPIYNSQADEVKANKDHVFYHGVTPDAIEDSVEFIFDNLDYVGQGMSKDDLDALKSALKGKHSFVKKESPLYHFMCNKYDIGSAAMSSEQFPDHVMMSNADIAQAKTHFYDTMKKSPFGNIHDSKCAITRGDGKSWNSPEGMSPSEYKVYSNTLNQVCFKVRYVIQAHEVPQNLDQ